MQKERAPVPKIKMPAILLEGDEPVVGKRPVSPLIVHAAETEPEVEPSDLPEAFGTGKLLLIPRDPTTLYAAWDFTAEQQRSANAGSVHGRMVLLIWKKEPGGSLAAEIEVHPDSRHWFAHVSFPGEVYRAEIGYYDAARNWHSMALSAAVRAPGGPPPAVPSAATFQLAEVWPEKAQKPKEKLSEPSPAPASELFVQHVRIPISEVRHEEPATEEPFRTAVSGPLPGPSSAAVVPQTQPEWTEAQTREILEAAGVSLETSQGPSSIEIAELLARMAEQGAQVSSIEAALAWAAEQAGAGLPAGVSSEQVPPGEAVEAGPGRKFWLQVNAELVVYGATAPDATVTIGGRRIRLREDGSFSYRFSLPDGTHELPVAAQSSDGEIRSADMAFSRKTVHSGDVGAHPQDSSLKRPSPENVS